MHCSLQFTTLLRRQFVKPASCYLAVTRGVHCSRRVSLPQPFTFVAQSRQDYRRTQSKELDPPFPETNESDLRPQQDPLADNVSKRLCTAFDIRDRVYIVTGGAGGIGLAMSEALAEAGGEVHCLDRNEAPGTEFNTTRKYLHSEPSAGTLHYHHVDVNNSKGLEATVGAIAAKRERLDGLIAAAGSIQITRAMDYDMGDAQKLMDINFIGVLASANACAKQMFKYKIQGSMCLIASMSGLIANKGLFSPVYNSSKAAVIQLARNLSMEWSKVRGDGVGGIRVNALSPGHVITPTVRQTFKEAPGVQEVWEAENLMGRLGEPSEFKGAALFLLSDASSFMTGNNLVVDGGHTAW